MAALQVVIEQFTAERLEGRCSGWELFPQPGQVIDFTTQKDAHFYTMIDAVRPVPNQPEEVTLTLVPISGSPTLPIKEARQLSQAQFYSLKSQAHAVIPIHMGDMIFDLDDMGPLVFVEPDEQRSYEHIIAGFHQSKHPVIIIDPIGVDLTPIGIEPTLIGKDIRLSLQDVGILNVLNWVIQKLPNAVQGQASEFLLSLVPPTPDFVPLQYFADHPRLQEHHLSAAVLHQMFVFHKAHFFANTKQMALGHQHLQHTLHLDFSNVPPDLVSYMAEGLTNVLLRYNLPKKAQLVVISPETNEASVNKLMSQSKHRMLLVGHNEKPWQSQITDWWETKKIMGEYGLVIRGEMTDDVQLFLPFNAMTATDTGSIAVVTPAVVEDDRVDTASVEDIVDERVEEEGLHVDWTPPESKPAQSAEAGSDYWIDQFNTEIISPEEEAARHVEISEESHEFIIDNAKPLPLKPDEPALSEADLYNLSFLESLKSKVDSPFAEEDTSADALDAMDNEPSESVDLDSSAWIEADDDQADRAENVGVLTSDRDDDEAARLLSDDHDTAIDDMIESLQAGLEADAETTADDDTTTTLEGTLPINTADDAVASSPSDSGISDIVIDWVQQSGAQSHAVDFIRNDEWNAPQSYTTGESASTQENYFVEGDFNELSQAAASMASSTSEDDINAYIDPEHPELTNAEDLLSNVFGYDATTASIEVHDETPVNTTPSGTIDPDEVIDLERPELTDAETLLTNVFGYDALMRDAADLDDTTSPVRDVTPSSTVDPDEVINLDQPELTDAETVLNSLMGYDKPVRERDLLDLHDPVSPTASIDPNAEVDLEHPELTDATSILHSLLGPDALTSPIRDEDDHSLEGPVADDHADALISSLLDEPTNAETESSLDSANVDEDTSMPEIDYGDDITFISDVPSSRYRRSYEDDDDLQAASADSWTIGGDTSGLMGGMGYFGDGSDNSLLLEFSDMTMETGNDASGFYRLLEVDIPDITKGIPPIPIIPTGNLEFEGDVGNLENFEDLSREIASDLIETVHTAKLEAKQEDLELEAQVIQGSTKAYEQVYEETSDPTLRELQQWQGLSHDDDAVGYGDGIDLDINDLLNPIPASSVAQPTHINDDEDGIGAFSLDDLGFEDSAAPDAAASEADWMNQLFNPNEGTSESIAPTSGLTATGELTSLDTIQSGGEYLGMGTDGMGWELQLTRGADQLNAANSEVVSFDFDGGSPVDAEANLTSADLMEPYEAPSASDTDATVDTTSESADESVTETDWQSLIAAASDNVDDSVSTWDFAETPADEGNTVAQISDSELDELDSSLQERVSHAAFNFDEEGTLMGDMDFEGLGLVNFGDESESEATHAEDISASWAETENTPYNENDASDLGILMNAEPETNAPADVSLDALSDTLDTPEMSLDGLSDHLTEAPDTTLEFGELALNDPYAFPDPASEMTTPFDAADKPGTDPLEGWSLTDEELAGIGLSDLATDDTAAHALDDTQSADYQSIAMDLDDDLMEVLKLEGVDFDMMATATPGNETPVIEDEDNLSIMAADDLFGDLSDLESSINTTLPSLNETEDEPTSLEDAAEGIEASTEAGEWGFDFDASLDDMTDLTAEPAAPMAELESFDPIKAHDVADLDLLAGLTDSPEATTPLDADGEWLFESSLDIAPMAAADAVVDIAETPDASDALADLMGEAPSLDNDMPMLDLSWEDEMAALGQAPIQEVPASQPALEPMPTAASNDEWLFPEFDDPAVMAPAASSNGMGNPMQEAMPSHQEVWIDDPTAPLPVDTAEPLTIVKTSLDVQSNRFKPGDHVQHKRYGMGTIKRIITMDDAQVILNINFDNVGKRLLDPSLSELEKVS